MAQHGPGPGEGAGPPLHRFLDALTFESIAKKGYRGRKFGGIFEIKCGRKCEILLRCVERFAETGWECWKQMFVNQHI